MAWSPAICQIQSCVSLVVRRDFTASRAVPESPRRAHFMGTLCGVKRYYKLRKQDGSNKPDAEIQVVPLAESRPVPVSKCWKVTSSAPVAFLPVLSSRVCLRRAIE
ncbi:hypothetical protein SRHO_G00251060 [Serrasalmus rhombeus]